MKRVSKIIFCTSYLFLPITITIIERFKKSVLIITGSPEIYKFLTRFYPKSQIILFKKTKKILYKNPIRILKNLYINYLLKSRIKISLNKYKNCEVYTFITAFSPQTAYALRILSSQNTIYWKKLISFKFLYKKKFPSFKIFLVMLYMRAMYKLNFVSYEGTDKLPILIYSNKFYKSISAKKTNIKPDIKLLKNFQKKNLGIKKKDILLLSSAEALELNIIDKPLYKIWINKWVNSLNSKQIALKRKFYGEKKYFSENSLTELPLDWPANLLMYDFRLVVGYHSATLFEAANAGCKVISLLDLLSNKKNSHHISYHKKYITRNLDKNKKILFPKTFEQFNLMINSVKNLNIN